MPSPQEIRKELEDVAPNSRGLLADPERKLLLERRAARAREIGDDTAVRRYGHQATEALVATQSGAGNLSRTPELPHFAGEITIHRAEAESEDAIQAAPTDSSAQPPVAH